MRLIIDANPLFSALIKEGYTVRIIVNADIQLFAPEFLFDEFLEHEEEILRKTKRTAQELRDLLENLREVIHVVPRREFESFIEEAKKLTSDEDDVPYLALALKLGFPIWSNDKALKRQDKVKVYSTEGLVERLRKMQGQQYKFK
ncbi:MAG: hypothetical protein KJ709_01015 [Nanoarchaeota archaeon]|nr:hypothetical protein [Nanoarchaeota archaeon]